MKKSNSRPLLGMKAIIFIWVRKCGVDLRNIANKCIEPHHWLDEGENVCDYLNDALFLCYFLKIDFVQ